MNKIYRTLLISVLILSTVLVAQASNENEKIMRRDKEYVCVDKVANASPPPDIILSGIILVKKVKEQPLCPEGKVPLSSIAIPDSVNKRKNLPPVDTKVANHNQDKAEGQVIHDAPSLICDKNGMNCAWYDWAYSHQRIYNTGATAVLSEHSPYVNPADYHSLAEIAVQNTNFDGRTGIGDAVEVGWTKDRRWGDVTKLFTYHWINGESTCYPTVYDRCGWQPVSNTKYPGMPISTPSFNDYAIQYREGKWWVWYGGEWIGYYPGSEWSGSFTDSNYIQYFGEVALSSSLPSDTEMGSGLISSYPDAAVIIDEAYYNNGWIDSNTTENATTPSRYSITRYLSNFTNFLRYGGPRFPCLSCPYVSGQLFIDLNGNGIKDPNEPGLSNWTISLGGIIGTGKDTRVIREETTTDTLGFYKFDNLTAGRYIVIEKLQKGFVPTSSPVKNVQLAAGENATINFTNKPVESLIPPIPCPLCPSPSPPPVPCISGTKFNDSDGDGIRQPNEVGLTNWKIDLYINGSLYKKTITDANGNYKFCDIERGNYTVKEVLQPGWKQTAPQPIPPGTYTGFFDGTTTISGLDFGNKEGG